MFILLLLYYYIIFLCTPTTWREDRDQIWSNTPYPGSMNLQTNKQSDQHRCKLGRSMTTQTSHINSSGAYQLEPVNSIRANLNVEVEGDERNLYIHPCTDETIMTVWL